MFAMGQICRAELTGVHFREFQRVSSERAVFAHFFLFARVHQRWLGQFSCFVKAATLGPVFARDANAL